MNAEMIIDRCVVFAGRPTIEQLLSREMVVAKAAELQILIPEGVAQVPPHFTPILSPFFSILSHKMDVLSWLMNRMEFFPPFYPF